MPRAGAEPGQEVEARRDLAKPGEVVLDEKGAVVAERLGLDIVLDELAETLAAVDLGAAAPGLRTAKKSKPHRLLLKLSARVPNPAPTPALALRGPTQR